MLSSLLKLSLLLRLSIFSISFPAFRVHLNLPYLPEVQHLLAAFVFAEPRGIFLLGLEAPGSIATGASLQPLN